GFVRRLLQAQIEHAVVDMVEALEPFVLRLDVHRTNAVLPRRAQMRDQMAADESAAAADNRQWFAHDLLVVRSFRCRPSGRYGRDPDIRVPFPVLLRAKPRAD